MEFIDSLKLFILSGENISNNPQISYPLLIFSISSSLMGIIVVLLDWLAVLAGRRSHLNLIYRKFNILLFAFVWGLGAGIGGFLGGVIGIFQINCIASISAGLFWPAILPRLIRGTANNEDKESFEGEDIK